MEKYMMAHGITDLGNYRLYELKVSNVKDGEAVMGFTEASNLLEEENSEPPQQRLEPDGGDH